MVQNIKTVAKKGFTLIELLIVIGILAILATTAVIILNPAQLLAQARDSQRLSDLGSLNSALAFYATDVSTASQDYNHTVLDNDPGCDTGAGASSYAAVDVTNVSFTAAVEVTDATREVTGVGWLPVNLGLISIGSPLSSLPVDPTNTGNLVYRYACNQPVAFTSGTYELNACLESTKYMTQMDTDGGNKNGTGTDACAAARYYETGTEPGLDL